MGTLTVDLSTCMIWTGSGSFSGGAIHQNAVDDYLEFTIPYAIDMSEDVTIDVDVVRTAGGTSLKFYRWLTPHLDESPGSTALTPQPTVTAAANATLTVSMTLPADHPTGWATASAWGTPVYFDIGFDRVDRVTAVRISQDSIVGGDPEPTYVGNGDGFDFGVDADVVTTPTFDPLDMVPLPVVAVAVPVPSGFANGVPL